MKKYVTFIIIFVILIILLVLVGYFNHDKIDTYIGNEDWLDKEPTASVTTQNIITNSASNYLTIFTNDGLSIYTQDASLIKNENLNSNKVSLCGNGPYTAVYAEDTKILYLYKDKEQIWNKTISNSIKDVVIHDNGFVSICFLQNGYKSGVTLFNNNGEAILTSYLASSYAVNTLLSKDFKLFYIAEVNTAGIKPKSSIRIIELNSKNNKEIANIEIASNEIITDIDYGFNENILILTDSAIYNLSKDNIVSNITKFNETNTLFASITNCINPCVVGYDTADEVVLKRFGDEEYTIKLSSVPQAYATMNNKIAVAVDDVIHIYNEKNQELARIIVKNSVSDLRFVKNASCLAVVYKNKIDFIKL